jgi:hypothetical protein
MKDGVVCQEGKTGVTNEASGYPTAEGNVLNLYLIKGEEMEKQFGIDRTVGSVPRYLLSYTIPMFLSNLIQVGYSLVNTIRVGVLVAKI